MASTRLPGKVLLELGGRSVLSHVVQRCRAVVGADEIGIAISEEPDNEPIVDEARRLGASVQRGPEVDVLERYRRAAEALCADVIMRVTSDSPMIDSAVCSEVLSLMRNSDVDYACNNLPASFPYVLDCAAFTSEALQPFP